jgi:transcriptional regulator with XRE-family HTH domain
MATDTLELPDIWSTLAPELHSQLIISHKSEQAVADESNVELSRLQAFLKGEEVPTNKELNDICNVINVPLVQLIEQTGLLPSGESSEPNDPDYAGVQAQRESEDTSSVGSSSYKLVKKIVEEARWGGGGDTEIGYYDIRSLVPSIFKRAGTERGEVALVFVNKISNMTIKIVTGMDAKTGRLDLIGSDEQPRILVKVIDNVSNLVIESWESRVLLKKLDWHKKLSEAVYFAMLRAGSRPVCLLCKKKSIQTDMAVTRIEGKCLWVCMHTPRCGGKSRVAPLIPEVKRFVSPSQK